MSDVSTAMAKLSGIRHALAAVMNENVSNRRSTGEVKTRSHFEPDQVQHYFFQAHNQIGALRNLLPDLYNDFQLIDIIPRLQMAPPAPAQFSRAQLERLVRDIDQVFEIRANSQLEQPAQHVEPRVFITHGRSSDWLAVQAFVDKDVKLSTIELAQEPNAGRTVIEKLEDYAGRCNSAVIVMTGDDVANGDEARVRENVMHEIGFFQGRYGRKAVIMLHEDGVNIPTNLAGLVYIAFPKGSIESGYHVLQRELKAIYK
jgi:predicted nucleotide-binding protein